MSNVPDTTEIEQQSHVLDTRARAITIRSSADLEDAGLFLRQVKTLQKQVADTFDAPIKAAHDAHKSVIAAKKRFTDPLDGAERMVKGKISTYQTEQERIRREEEARLQAQARRQEEERRLREAEELERAGHTAAAAAVIEAPIATAVVVPRQVPKVEGISTRKLWRHRVSDPMIVPREWLVPNDKALADYARRMADSASIPGVEFYAEEIVSATGF